MADNSQNSPMSRLPKAGAAAKPQSAVPNLPKPAAPNSPAPSYLPPKERSAPGGSKVGPAFWTIASIISLTVNVVVVVVLLAVLALLQQRNINVISLLPDLLGGLYSNFEKMDNAHIVKTIPVNAQIPVKFDLLLNQNTDVILSESVFIPNATVTVNTGGLNITGARASIILPAGTRLPVTLNLTVPVDTSIPVNLNVAVDIPLNETDLHIPFVGLQDVVKPLYCLVKTDATNTQNEAICK